VRSDRAHPLGLAILSLIGSFESKGETAWQGSPGELLDLLDRIASQKIRNQHPWPKAPNALVRKLNTIKSNLLEGLGIGVTISRITTGKNKNTSTIRIEKIPPLPPPSPPDQNHAQNKDKIGGGSLDSGDTTSIGQQVSPPETIEIHAQKVESGGSGDGGGSLPTLEVEEEVLYSSPLPPTYVAFDFEWSSSNTAVRGASTSIENQITAAAFVDNHRNSKVLHISDFSNSDNPERELIIAINQELMKYDFSIGWYSTGVAKYHEYTQEYLDGVDSDLAILHARCLANGIDSMVDFNSASIPCLKGQKHIDLHSIFGKPMVQTTIFKNDYRTLKLDEVSKAVLVDFEAGGKYKDLIGKDIQALPVEEQKRYVIRDAELVMQLSKHSNSEVLEAMKAISELTGIDFEKVCRTGISTWWAAIFDKISTHECEAPVIPSKRREQELTKLTYAGGVVLQPKKGLYHNLIVVDVASLYPSMAVLHNVSFDTVNCQCCKDNPDARIPVDIIKGCVIEKEYHICKLKEGAFSKKLRLFREERLKQKKLGNQIKQLALKILINGGYGVFGNYYFKYYDPRVAELITAYGRYTLSKMQEIATTVGFKVVYGDTDSLFLNYMNISNTTEAILKFQQECNKQLGIEVEYVKTYQIAIISDRKKHYVGWTGIQGKEPDIVGMEGDKNDRPKWINNVFRQTVYDIVVNNTDPIINLKRAISDLESGIINPELLKRSNRLSKNPEEYENENDRKRKIGLAIGARKGDVIEYFESDKNKEGYSLNPQDISIKKYKAMLWKAVKDILEIAGYDVATTEELFLSNMTTRQNLPVVWSGNANLLGGEQ
jgi:DNA polymerase, archaea type